MKVRGELYPKLILSLVPVPDAAVPCNEEKSEGGPVRAWLDLFRRGRLLVRNFSRQTRRPASWRRLYKLYRTRTTTTSEYSRVGTASSSFLLRFATRFSVNKGSNSATSGDVFATEARTWDFINLTKKEKKRSKKKNTRKSKVRKVHTKQSSSSFLLSAMYFYSSLFRCKNIHRASYTRW